MSSSRRQTCSRDPTVVDYIEQFRERSTDDHPVRDPMFELGAIPPFGGPAGETVIVDRHVAALERTFIEAGERKLSLQMRSDDLVSVTDATVADLIEE